MPNILVAGGNSAGALEGLAATLMQHVSKLDEKKEEKVGVTAKTGTEDEAQL